MQPTSTRSPVLIANRGEIAIRIARTCKALGFPTVAIYSDADRFSEHVRACDRAYWVGGSSPKESYLNIQRILAAAQQAKAGFIHPGYGFLSERPQFAEACAKAGIVFVGPTAESMEVMGDKIRARMLVDSLKVPRVPGSPEAVRNSSEAEKVAQEIGYPILLKAAAGGGGKGMRRVDSPEEISSAFERASGEALRAFGDGSIYVEKLVLSPHHVEIQVFGDGRGDAIHLGERECSIQRRHQKIWEESPAPILNRFPETRGRMQEAALKIARHVRYSGAGTLEFIVDEAGNFYFLEMNTRLQVEHPVTEWVTGMDLVAMQLLLAAGELELPEIPECRGSAIEVRLYAEDPSNFLPAPGPLGFIKLPSGPFVRVDTAFTGAGEVSVHYDPMIAKIAVWAPTRELAVERLQVALDETRVEPPKKADGTQIGSLKTNLSFLRRLVRNSKVRSGNTPTNLIESSPELTQKSQGTQPSREAAIALSLFQLIQESEWATEANQTPSNWARRARLEGVRE